MPYFNSKRIVFCISIVLGTVLSGCSNLKHELSKSASATSVPARLEAPGVASTEKPPVSIDEVAGKVLQEEIFRDSQRRIAACMKVAGYTYIPRSWRPEYFSPIVVNVDATLKDLRKNGYGNLVLFATGQVEQAAASRGLEPNDEVINSLSQQDQSQYARALNGPEGSSSKGCNDSSVKEAYEKISAGSFEIFSDFGRVDAEVNRSSEYQAVEKAWRKCMAANGWKIQRIADAPPFVLGLVAEEAKRAGSIKNITKSSISALRQLEMSVSSDDADCQEKYVTEVVKSLQTKSLALAARKP